MKRHDEASWRAFHDAYFQRLLRYLTVMFGGDDDAAAECVQKTYLRVVRHIKVFKAEPEFWRWLACLARCTAMDHQRSRRRYFELMERFDHFLEMRRDDPRSDGLAGGFRRALEHHLAGWRDEDRSLFERKYMEGWTCAELARELDLSEKAVESRLGRLRQRLREHLLKATDHESVR